MSEVKVGMKHSKYAEWFLKHYPRDCRGCEYLDNLDVACCYPFYGSCKLDRHPEG